MSTLYTLIFLFSSLVYLLPSFLPERSKLFRGKRSRPIEQIFPGISVRILYDFGEEDVEYGTYFRSWCEAEVLHEIATAYFQHFYRNRIVRDFLDDVFEMTELVRLRFRDAGTETVGYTELDQIFHILESDSADESANRGFGHFADIVVKHMLIDEHRRPFYDFPGIAESSQYGASHACADMLMTMKGGVRASSTFCPRFSDVMEERGEPYIQFLRSTCPQ